MTVSKKNSVYIRTIISLTLATVFVFAVLSFMYYQRMSSSIIVDESEHLDTVTYNLSLGLVNIQSDVCVDQQGYSIVEDVFLLSNAMVQNRFIWIVDSKGHIDYSTGFPDQVSDNILINGDHVNISDDYIDVFFRNGAGNTTNSRQHEFFEDDRDVWISSAHPIQDTDQYLLIHRAINVERQALEMLSNALALPLAISFTLALVLFILMTHSIVRPIRLMSDLAQRVSRGDWSARIRSRDVHVDSPFKYLIVDEISNMISTVNDMIDKLERQDADRRIFISSIAHDLRTPLTSINGFLTAIMDGTIPPEKCEHYMKVIKGEVERIQNLTEMMTEASSMGQTENLRMESFDINDMIKEVLTNLEHQLRQKELGVQLDLFTNEKNQLLAYGDTQAIIRVLYNLLTNAIKFTPRDGNIAITTYFELSDNQVLISVEDSGLGIPEDQRSRVFESFYKTDGARTNMGSGLGLYICKEILRAHNQDIRVMSGKELGGARFVFTLEGASEMNE